MRWSVVEPAAAMAWLGRGGADGLYLIYPRLRVDMRTFFGFSADSSGYSAEGDEA